MEITITILTGIIVGVSLMVWHQSNIINGLKLDLKRANNDLESFCTERNNEQKSHDETIKKLTAQNEEISKELEKHKTPHKPINFQGWGK